jgi:XTP/dITP diphosphohydrolase
MKQLVLATHNKHKVEELQAMLVGTSIKVLTLDSFPHVGDIVEDEETLEGNALKKAREVFRATSLPSLADDTGLEVHFLYDSPGVYSSRFSGPNATYAENVKKLLSALQSVPSRRRGARFRSVLAFVAPGTEEVAEGICPGVITEEPRGTDGFGYDPVFLPSGFNQTFAEMSLDLKNSISHRGRALQKMRPLLLEYFA